MNYMTSLISDTSSHPILSYLFFWYTLYFYFMYSLGALAWSLNTLCTAHGQPTQNVALASFIRIVVKACKTVAPHPLLFTPTTLDQVQGLAS